jgi:MFS family permease
MGFVAVRPLRMLLTRQQVRLLLPLGTAVALSLTGDSTLYAVLANQTETVGITLGMVGVLLGVNRLIRVPGNLAAGALNDRLGRRRLFLWGLFLGVLSTLGYGLVRGFWPFFATRVLWGISWALINVGGYNMVLDWSLPENRGRMTGFYQVSYMLGLAFSPLLGGVLTDALGFRPAVFICAAVSAAGLLVALVALPETRPRPDRAATRGARTHWSWAQVAGLFRKADHQILAAAYVYLTVFFVSSGVLVSTISLYLRQKWGTAISLDGVVIGVASLAGIMLALRASLGMLAGPLAGASSDRLENRWPVVWAGILLGSTGFLLLVLVAQLWAVLIGVALVSLSAGALLAVLAALVGDRATAGRQGVMMGALAAAGDIGSAAGPLLAYALAVTLELRWVYLMCAVVLASGLIVSGVRRQRPCP